MTFGYGNNVLDMTPEAQSMKEMVRILISWTLLTLKTSALQGTYKENKKITTD